MAEKQCTKCQQCKPATPAFFSRNKNKPDGLHTSCKQCTRKVNPLLADKRPNTITLTRGYKTELDLNNQQRTLCLKHAGTARFAWNWGLARSIEQYNTTGKRPSAMELHRQLNALKQTDFPWMYQVSKCAPQEALRNLDTAYKHFFRRCKEKKQGTFKGKLGFPRFKSKKQGKGSFRLTGSIRISEDAIQLPCLGRVRVKELGYLPVRAVNILSATVSEQAGRWYVSVQVEEKIPDPTPATGTPVGVDLGITALATLSDGSSFANPQALRSRLTTLRRASRRLSRKQKESKNREKARKKLARVHARIAHIREDALHKATSAIVAKTRPQAERPRVIAIEDLNVSGMLKNRRLSRSIGDVGFSEFKRQLIYKAEQAGSAVLVVNQWYPSSKTCSCCGWKWDDMTLKNRVFVCIECGYMTDRDYNAAKNLAAVIPEPVTTS